jgi:hypothetical protein
MENIYTKLQNAIALFMATLVLLFTGFVFYRVGEAIVSHNFALMLNAWVANFTTIPMAITALWLMVAKNKTDIIGRAFLLGCLEQLVVASAVLLTGLLADSLLKALLLALVSAGVVFFLMMFAHCWNVSRRIAEGTYVSEEDEEALREQEAALREMLS